jgi:hypothetical protein
MAYGDDIDLLGNAHRYILSADATDSVGTNDGTNTGGVFTGSAICEDVTNSYTTASSTDTLLLPDATTINSATQSLKAVGGWFMVTSIQTPPRRIYGEGNTNTNFQFMCAYGNNSMLEIASSGSFTLQVFGPILEINRPYHLLGTFEGSLFSNEVRFFVDGVEQTLAEPTNRQPDTTLLAARTVSEFGDPSGTVGLGNVDLASTANVKGQYNQWAFWDGSNAALTSTEIREELFEKGALPNVTISSDSIVNMQLDLDAQADILGGNYPLDIRIEDTTDIVAGDINLTLDNRTFDDLTSIHIQWMGTDNLVLLNSNGSNASIASTPNGGTVEFVEEVTISITCKDASTGDAIEIPRIYIIDSNSDVIVNDLADVTGIYTIGYAYTSDEIVTGRVRRADSSPYYKTGTISGTITSSGLTLTVLMIKDE